MNEKKRENNKQSGTEDAPDGNAAVHGDVDSRPSEGEPAGEDSISFLWDSTA